MLDTYLHLVVQLGLLASVMDQVTGAQAHLEHRPLQQVLQVVMELELV